MPDAIFHTKIGNFTKYNNISYSSRYVSFIAILNSLLCMKHALFRLNGHWYGAYNSAQCLRTPQGFLKSLQVSNLAQY